MALKTLGPSIINIYHSHILPVILLTGAKFCDSLKKKKDTLFIYINAGATVEDNICASSTLAMTCDPHYDIIDGAVVTRSAADGRFSSAGTDLVQSRSQTHPQGPPSSLLTFSLL